MQRPKILIVDDDPSILALIQKYLGHLDCDVRSADKAVDALRQLDSFLPDVILTDAMMPEMDGYQFVEALKQFEVARDIPVIMVTALSEIGDKVRALDTGIFDFLSKPLNKAELLARVRSVLRLKRESDRRKARERELEKANLLLQEANVKLEHLSVMDGLTGVPNRRYFDEHLVKEWRRARRNDTSLGLIMVDIDFFKRYNDTYGHQQGDECLKQVARAASLALQRASEFLARYGGEEFAVIIADADINEVMYVAERIRLLVAKLGLAHESSVCCDHVSVSLGIASDSPGGIETVKKLVEAADKSLYWAKERGRNRVGIELAAEV